MPPGASPQSFAYVPAPQQGQPAYHSVHSSASPHAPATPDNQKVPLTPTPPTSLPSPQASSQDLPGASGTFPKPGPASAVPQQTIIVVPSSMALQNNYIIKNLPQPPGFVPAPAVVDKPPSTPTPSPSPTTTQAGADPSKGNTVIYLPS
ncbi:uncharacterized protein LOC127008473 [Eriocheir sinensis]|uniref:uncharacterized protein LOC127008473 n=1 Tax=Eriocheir sinensis TaxID=95602 RepID=UPI0021C834AE|nr:uncharacterized protein LOC127008473 [Eriocheir sinensis]